MVDGALYNFLEGAAVSPGEEGKFSTMEK